MEDVRIVLGLFVCKLLDILLRTLWINNVAMEAKLESPLLKPIFDF